MRYVLYWAYEAQALLCSPTARVRPGSLPTLRSPLLRRRVGSRRPSVEGGHSLDHVAAAPLVARRPFRCCRGDLRCLRPCPFRIVLEAAHLGEQICLDTMPGCCLLVGLPAPARG